jgi:hypothetical protein
MSKLSGLDKLADLLEAGWRVYTGKAAETPPDKYIALEELIEELRKVKISSDDTTPDYIGSKIIGTTDVLTITIVNPAGDEQLQLDLPTTIVGNRFFGGQAAGGIEVVTFSPTASFDLDNGNSQVMTLLGNLSSLNVTSKVNGGSYLIYLKQDGAGGRIIPTPGASFGAKTDNSADFITTSNGVNLININVDPSGITYYTIETYTF